METEPLELETVAQSFEESGGFNGDMCKTELNMDSSELLSVNASPRTGAVSRKKRAERDTETTTFDSLEGVATPGLEDRFSPWMTNEKAFADQSLQSSGLDTSFKASFHMHSVATMAANPAMYPTAL